ncbi:uncharacterized protein EV420DRAFT_1530370 [Desarmillaria tabescens]|uniref:Uncharacterized protein n=1 Tax=Armillaria tabescens TaxID=1929756 RepID=A0AA39N8R7_ARMTA|nr:uncharacterized protein EV420DRAFT_1530370 [Desarmillaria tabescens]KAK0461121.1 hypothetical protein EV420DRAFT_1530370 [Desarmillaria tabescens]
MDLLPTVVLVVSNTMGFLTSFHYSSKSHAVVVADEPESSQPGPQVDSPAGPLSISPNSEYQLCNQQSVSAHVMSSEELTVEITPFPMEETAPPRTKQRHLSFHPFARRRRNHTDHKRSLSAAEEHEKKVNASSAALSKHFLLSSKARSDKRAKQSAEVVRALIVGQGGRSVKSSPAKPLVSQVKSELMKPKTANKVIAHLRDLSVEDLASQVSPPPRRKKGPIRAVCLANTDEQEHELHFAHINSDAGVSEEQTFGEFSVAAASADKLSQMFDEMHIVDLIRSPDLGLGQPGDGEGLLAGAVPTAETVLNGIQQITPQLMALGYATGKAVLPDHTGVYPPTDRMSVLTYWWGLEVALPPPTLAYLGNVRSISNAIVNFMSALALVNNGAREILPFVRYISQFVDFEFNAIKEQDKGRGVVCAATWIMPAAMVPRSWDFNPPPVGLISSAETSSQEDSESQEQDESDTGPVTPVSPSPPSQEPPATPVPLPIVTPTAADTPEKPKTAVAHLVPKVMVTASSPSPESIAPRASPAALVTPMV